MTVYMFRGVLAVTTAALALGPMAGSAALAQQQGYPPQQGSYDAPPPSGQSSQGYDDRDDGYGQDVPPPGYQGGPPQQGYDGYQGGPQGGPPPQQGYEGQQGGPPQQGYDGQQGYDDRGYGGPPPSGPGGYGGPGQQPPQGYAAPPPPPPGYNGSQPPPPPPGYQAGPDAAQQQAQDQQYAAYAQQWSQANCVKSRGDVGQGAVIGGVVGALLGSGLAGRGSHGTGALVGAGVGAAGGAVIADSSGSRATSPGCPPGFVQRSGAPPFAYGGSPYAYAAPEWYRPWVFYGGVWSYRPYPYHAWYSRHYGPRGYGYGRRGYDRRHW